MKLAKAFKSLDPGGLLIVNDFLLDDNKTGPLPAALFNIMVGAYSKKEIITLIQKVGFTKVALVSYDSIVGRGVITALRPKIRQKSS